LKKWERETAERFETLKANEEELNRIFIDIYGLQDELTPEVEDKDVTVHRIYDSKEASPIHGGSRYALTKQDAIKSFISYAVGCMFGRYSLDVEGLAYAGGEWDSEKYKTFVPTRTTSSPSATMSISTTISWGGLWISFECLWCGNFGRKPEIHRRRPWWQGYAA
jgi:hypothetical protein